MGYKFRKPVPWGRSLHEYLRMFNLSTDDLGGLILGCADGPASFNADMWKRGHSVISCDPLYALSKTQIELRIAESFPEVMRQAAENRDLLLWEQIKSLEHLRRIRAEAMNRFLADYGRADGPVRYVAAQLPELPFRSGTFDLALCSHLLFLYSDQLTRRFHDQAAIELCRVASEVRIFPLLTLDSEPSPYVNTVREALIERGYAVSIEAVPYEFQKGANRMMRVSRSRLDGSPHRPRGPVPE